MVRLPPNLGLGQTRNNGRISWEFRRGKLVECPGGIAKSHSWRWEIRFVVVDSRCAGDLPIPYHRPYSHTFAILKSSQSFVL